MKLGGLAPLLAALLAACGGGGGGDSSAPPPAVGTLTLVAGITGGPGTTDGPYATARFNNPTGLAFDGGGTLFITETEGNRVRMAMAGMVTTFAGDGFLGFRDGSAAQFYRPQGVATAVGQNVLVVDWLNRTIRQITRGGVVSTLAGQAGQQGFVDGTGAAARFNEPRAIVRDAVGNAIVTDGNAIRKVTPAGVVTTIAGVGAELGFRDGPALLARFTFPRALAIDDAGNLYIADTYNHAIRKLSVAGEVTTIAGAPERFGSDDGPAAVASFDAPHGLALGLDGTIYVSDLNRQVIRQISPAGQVSTLAGSAGLAGKVDGQGAAARFKLPAGLAFDNTTATLYVADSGNHTIRAVSRQGLVTTAIGAPPPTGAVDGPGTTARFANAADLAVDSAGNVLVADTDNRAIRRVDAAGNVTTIAGSLGESGIADGPLASARFGGPVGVTVDSAGAIFVVDHPMVFCRTPIVCDPLRSSIRKITASGVSTIAGSVEFPLGTADGTAATARFRVLDDIAVDAAGNLYVTEPQGPTIRKITPAGDVSTFAGMADMAGSVDGVGTEARFMAPHGIAIDGAGNLYVSDAYSRIRKITPAGVVSTFASGLGVDANRLSIDSDGNLYVSEQNTIRKITPDGVMTIIAGVPTIAGFTPGPLPAVVSPRSLVVNGRDLYIGLDAAVAVIRNRP